MQILALLTLAAFGTPLVSAVASQAYSWKSVKIGGGGGFVPGIVFNPKEKVSTTRLPRIQLALTGTCLPNSSGPCVWYLHHIMLPQSLF
jgi:hypothetical protein